MPALQTPSIQSLDRGLLILETGEFVPLYRTAHGKALLADCGATELKAILGSAELHAQTSWTITSVAQLAGDGVVVASIGISAPLARFPRERYAGAARIVCETARDITAILSAETPA
jgi:IclR family acetate operon transcriptional repressor